MFTLTAVLKMNDREIGFCGLFLVREVLVLYAVAQKAYKELEMYRVSQVLPPEGKHPLLINLKFSKNSEIIVYHCRTVCKNFKIFNETGKDFVLIQ
jgi:hypothetical protein